MVERLFAVLFVVFISLSTVSAQDSIYRAQVQAPLDEVYPRVYKSLEENKFFVVFEADIGRNIARFKERWGDEYNQQGLEGIRSMVVCNAWYTNQVSNKDPTMLALCPLRVNLYHKQGVTTVLFARPTALAKGSPAESVLQEAESTIIQAIEDALR